MFLNLKRIFMNEVDAGGNSAPAAPAAAADVPQAQGAAVTMTKTEFDAAIASAAEQAIARAKDGIFAEARRTFTAPSKTGRKSDEQTAPIAPAQQDPMKLRKLDRAITSAGLKPTDLAYELAEQAWMSSGDESDPVGWTKGFFDRLGVSSAPASQPAPAQTTASQAAPARNAAPVSDRGSPPVSAVPLEDQNVISMSHSDREALRKLKGDKWFTDRVLEQSRGHTVKLR